LSDLTVILEKAVAGDRQAAEQIFPLVYDELRKLAAFKMSLEAPGHTLQPTALVHEAWLRLGGDQQPEWKGRAHFFGAAAEAMRRILVDRARRRRAAKRGGGFAAISDEGWDIPAAAAPDDQLIILDEALEKLSRLEPHKAELVKLRYFVGMNYEEAARVLGIAIPTAKQWWAYSRAWLTRELQKTP
jgi:RNA polymerase sigma factor (TIGR02999 family)